MENVAEQLQVVREVALSKDYCRELVSALSPLRVGYAASTTYLDRATRFARRPESDSLPQYVAAAEQDGSGSCAVTWARAFALGLRRRERRGLLRQLYRQRCDEFFH
jgi:hypothetical protein